MSFPLSPFIAVSSRKLDASGSRVGDRVFQHLPYATDTSASASEPVRFPRHLYGDRQTQEVDAQYAAVVRPVPLELQEAIS